MNNFAHFAKKNSLKKQEVINLFILQIRQREYFNLLVDWGYKEETASGLQSTAYQYVWAINFVINAEIITYETLIKDIDKYIKKYDKFGKNSKLGELGHNTVICSLKKFKEFIIYKDLIKNNKEIKTLKLD